MLALCEIQLCTWVNIRANDILVALLLLHLLFGSTNCKFWNECSKYDIINLHWNWIGLVPHYGWSNSRVSDTIVLQNVLICAAVTHSATDDLIKSLMLSVKRLHDLP